MQFHLEPIQPHCRVNCAIAIVAEGEIMEETPQEFRNFIRQHASRQNLRSIIFMHSEGGRVIASMELGEMFRRISAVTVVARVRALEDGPQFSSAQCLSACVYAFMGGKERVVPPPSFLGVHRMFIRELSFDLNHGLGYQDIHDDGAMAQELSDYCARMGVSREVAKSAEQGDSQVIRIVSREKMRRWRLAREKL